MYYRENGKIIKNIIENYDGSEPQKLKILWIIVPIIIFIILFIIYRYVR
jgi:hypothetical protein